MVVPKSVARDLYERAMTFGDYVAHYGLARSEGLVLRYLSNCYHALSRPAEAHLLAVSEAGGAPLLPLDPDYAERYPPLRYSRLT